MNKLELLDQGIDLMYRFCELNQVSRPTVVRVPSKDWYFGSTCAYYRKNTITICLEKCSHIGTSGASWSYPGYTVDRTPYGVIQHELGHHVDVLHSSTPGPYFSVSIRKRTEEKQISSYAPNDAEWFAEMFRVFVTNPNLLQAVRPATFAAFAGIWAPVFSDTWRERLADAPPRTIAAIERKLTA